MSLRSLRFTAVDLHDDDDEEEKERDLDEEFGIRRPAGSLRVRKDQDQVDDHHHEDDENEEEEADGDARDLRAKVHTYQHTLAPQKRRRLALMVVLMVLFTIMGIALIVDNSRKGSELRSVHVQFPDEIRDQMLPQSHPCQDFYEYACGQWLASTPLPADRSTFSMSFSQVHDKNDALLHEIMLQDWPLLGELFQSCMNTTRLDQLGFQPIENTLRTIQNVGSKQQLFELAGELSRTSGDLLLTSLMIQPDLHNATQYALYIGQNGLSLPDPSYYLDQDLAQEFVPALKEFVGTLLQLANFTSQEVALGKEKVVEIEQQLAAMFVAKEKLMDPAQTYNPVTLQDARAAYPFLFDAYLYGTSIPLKRNSSTTPFPVKDRTATQQQQQIRILVETPSFFNQAEELVNKRDLSEWKLVLAYNFIRVNAPLLSEPFVKAIFDFFGGKINGQEQMLPRWRTCTARVEVFFPELTGKYFFMNYFDAASESSAHEMVMLIEKAMRRQLETTPWLDEPTRKAALNKLALVANLIGHSTQQVSYTFALARDQLVQNVQTLMAFEFERATSKLSQYPVNRNEWFMSAAAVNAYYDLTQNQMVFPAGILQEPFFNAKRYHPARNFGSIGMIIAHELTHAFDDHGKMYDGHGNLNPWWSNATQQEFERRSQCLVEQYGRFKVFSDPVVQNSSNGTTRPSTISTTAMKTDPDGAPSSLANKNQTSTTKVSQSSLQFLGNVNGNFTLGENIADNGGLKVAFQAYQEYVAANRTSNDELFTPQLTTTDAERLFFISFAQTFCDKATDAARLRILESNPHPPGRARVNGAIMNNADFNRVFDCVVGTPMNPDKVCELW